MLRQLDGSLCRTRSLQRNGKLNPPIGDISSKGIPGIIDLRVVLLIASSNAIMELYVPADINWFVPEPRGITNHKGSAH